MIKLSARPVGTNQKSNHETHERHETRTELIRTFMIISGVSCISWLLPPRSVSRQRPLTFHQGGVRIIKAAEPWVRREVRKIFLRQLPQRPDHRGGSAHGFTREGVRLVFVLARE